ncbi:MAG: L-histidine N(alpha)-methyltransferase [Planctomycetota bacterium]
MELQPEEQLAAQRPTRTPRFIQGALPAGNDVAKTLVAGLQEPTANIPARFLYDELGSCLFDAITALPEYYPTRTEAAVLEKNLPAMAKEHDSVGGTLIDLGAGTCEKAPKLFPYVKPTQYVPVDISVEFLRTAVHRLQHDHPDISMVGVGTDFSSKLELPDEVGQQRRLFFYPGSSIGNFSRDEAIAFLKGVRSAMDAEGQLWIGIDLRKDIATMVRAYDDEIGVTAAFSRNTLRNTNRLAGTDFSPRHWDHVALFNEEHSRVEMHLEAKQDVVVRWPGGERKFTAGERIHTENSHKYTQDGFSELLAEAGLETSGCWTDEKKWFGVFVAVPAGR